MVMHLDSAVKNEGDPLIIGILSALIVLSLATCFIILIRFVKRGIKETRVKTRIVAPAVATARPEEDALVVVLHANN
jgi:hypothetical protein